MNWIEEVERCGGQRACAKEHGIPRSTLQGWIKRGVGLPASPAAEREKSVPDSVIPFGMTTSGTSTLYDDLGNPRLTWVKTKQDPDQLREALKSASEEFARTITPCIPDMKPAPSCDEDLMTVYVLTDFHIGMLSWGEETGTPWDINIAEETLIRYFIKASQSSPNSKRAVLANIGDLLHFTGMSPQTPRSGHIVDTDSRFQKIIRVAIRALKIAVSVLLERHEFVHIIHGEGNHDDSASAWLREMSHSFYENEPRVTVNLNPDPYYCVVHGDVSLFFHHGHRQTPNAIAPTFASKFRLEYGTTKYSYAHMGHKHSHVIVTNNLMTVEQHPTLAGRDSYASGGGWMSDRWAAAVTYHRKYGEISRVTIPFEMINPSLD